MPLGTDLCFSGRLLNFSAPTFLWCGRDYRLKPISLSSSLWLAVTVTTYYYSCNVRTAFKDAFYIYVSLMRRSLSPDANPPEGTLRLVGRHTDRGMLKIVINSHWGLIDQDRSVV